MTWLAWLSVRTSSSDQIQAPLHARNVMPSYTIRIKAAEAEIAGRRWSALLWLLRNLPSSVDIQENHPLPCVFSSPGVAITKLDEGTISRHDVANGFFMRWSPTWDMHWESDLRWLERMHPDASKFVLKHFRLRRLDYKDYTPRSYRLISEA